MLVHIWCVSLSLRVLGKEHCILGSHLQSDHGAPILYYAIANKDADIVRLLVLAGCHIFTLMRDADNQEIPVLFSALTGDLSTELADALMPPNFPGQRELIRRLLYKVKSPYVHVYPEC